MVGPPTNPCPECGTRMVPAISGLRCPRFSACGRGGVEETAARIKHRLPHVRPQDTGFADAF